MIKTPESTDKKPKRKPIVLKTSPKQPQSSEREIQIIEVEPPVTRSSPQPEFEEGASRERSFDDFSSSRDRPFDDFSDSQNLVLRRRQKKWM